MSITGTLIIQMIVFLILVGFTMKFVWPPITTALDERAQKIAEGLAAADKAKADWPPPTSASRRSWPRRATTPPSAWPMPSAWRSRCRGSQGPRHRRRRQDRRRRPGRGRAAGRQGARGAARAGRRAGRQGRRADPAQGSQRRRPRRPARPPEDRAVRRPWLNSPPSPVRTPKRCSRRRRRRPDAAPAELARRARRRRRRPAAAPVRRQPEGRRRAGVRRGHRRRPRRRCRDAATNLLRTVIDNGRLAALPEIAAQFQRARRTRACGASRRHRRQRLPDRRARSSPTWSARWKSASAASSTPACVVDPTLIGGIRVVVGDEVLDTSVKARLEQMKVALTA